MSHVEFWSLSLRGADRWTPGERYHPGVRVFAPEAVLVQGNDPV